MHLEEKTVSGVLIKESNKDISDTPPTPFVKKLYEGQFRSVAQSCLTLCGPMDGDTWCAAVHGATKSQTQLSN